MKPIEIHIEGYKIVISKEDDKDGGDNKKEKITYTPKPKKDDDDKDDLTLPYTPPICPNLPYVPQNPDWWRYPYVTWTNDDVFNIGSTSDKSTIVRDFMVGKRKKQK